MSETCPTCGHITLSPGEFAQRSAAQVKRINAVQASIRAALGVRKPTRIWRLGRVSLAYRPRQ